MNTHRSETRYVDLVRCNQNNTGDVVGIVTESYQYVLEQTQLALRRSPEIILEPGEQYVGEAPATVSNPLAIPAKRK